MNQGQTPNFRGLFCVGQMVKKADYPFVSVDGFGYTAPLSHFGLFMPSASYAISVPIVVGN